jgi:hypothetical protein
VVENAGDSIVCSFGLLGQPVGRHDMPPRPMGPGDGGVGDVTHKGVVSAFK